MRKMSDTLRLMPSRKSREIMTSPFWLKMKRLLSIVNTTELLFLLFLLFLAKPVKPRSEIKTIGSLCGLHNQCPDAAVSLMWLKY